ncbi:MAG: permease, partial [Ilumatobacter sp.]
MLEASRDFSFAYLSILFEGAPFILVGAMISGVLDVFLPPGMMERILPKRKVPAILVAGLLGLFLPICECAVVPVIRRLVQKGLPISCGLTYMLAAPVINPITALSTWHAFQGQEPWVMVMARLGLAYLLAVGVGMITCRVPLAKMLTPKLVESIRRSIVAKKSPAYDPRSVKFVPHQASVKKVGMNTDERVVAAVRSGLRDFVDVGIYFSLGVAITAFFNTGIAPGADGLNRLAGGLATGPAAMMVLAFLLSLCSTSDAFIAATLHHFSFAAKLAFLTYGPLMDLKLIFLYRTVFRGRLIMALAAGLFLVIWLVTVMLGSLTP